MSKPAEEQKQKLGEKIKKAEAIIAAQKEKIKSWQQELKTIEAEERKVYADEFLNIIVENGLTSKEDKIEFLEEIKKFAKQTAAFKKEKISFSENEADEKNENFAETEKASEA